MLLCQLVARFTISLIQFLRITFKSIIEFSSLGDVPGKVFKAMSLKFFTGRFSTFHKKRCFEKKLFTLFWRENGWRSATILVFFKIKQTI